jgi:hypothetical protein
MEAWFDLPPAAAPPRHVMALLTLAAIWPLVSVPRGRRRRGREIDDGLIAKTQAAE